MAKDRIVLLSKDLGVQNKIAKFAGFGDVHHNSNLPKAKIEDGFWLRPDRKPEAQNESLRVVPLAKNKEPETYTYEPLNLKLDASHIKDITIVSSKDNPNAAQQPETFYVRVVHGDKTYVAVSVNAAYDQFKRDYFNLQDTVHPDFIRNSTTNGTLIVVSDVAKTLAPVEMVMRLAAGQEKSVVEKEGHLLSRHGNQLFDSSNYMPKNVSSAIKKEVFSEDAGVVTEVVQPVATPVPLRVQLLEEVEKTPEIAVVLPQVETTFDLKNPKSGSTGAARRPRIVREVNYPVTQSEEPSITPAIISAAKTASSNPMEPQQDNAQDIVAPDYPVVTLKPEEALVMIKYFIDNGISMPDQAILGMQNAGGFTLKIEN